MDRKISLKKIREYELDLIVPLLPSGSRILEVGAGAGWQSKILNDNGFVVEAIDVKGSRYENRRVWPVVLYDGVNIPFPNAYFDIVISSNVLEHVGQVTKILNEIKRVLKPGGTAVHVVPSGSWRVWSIFATIINAWKALLISIFSKFYHSYILSDMTGARAVSYKQSMAKLLKQITSFPSAHGEIGNCFSEIYLYRKLRWNALFRRTGWTIKSCNSNKLFYSGGTCLTMLSIKARHIISYILGSSSHIYILKNSEDDNILNQFEKQNQR